MSEFLLRRSPLFPIVHTSDDKEYQLHHNAQGCMILFGKSNISNYDYPLLAIELKCNPQDKTNDNNNEDAIQFICRPDPETDRFQGIVNVDNSVIELKVHNLLPQGNVYFSIFHCNAQGIATNQQPINEINIVAAGATYVVKSDATRNHGQLILSSIKTQQNKTLTVAEDEKQSTQGTYMIITVVPEKVPFLTGLFASTFWATPEYFVQKRPASPATYNVRRIINQQRSFNSDNEGCELELHSKSFSRGKQSIKDLVNNSTAATLKVGKKIKTYSHFVNVNLARELASKPAILGLSVETRLERNKNRVDADEKYWIEITNRLIGEIQQSKYAEFLCGTRFVAEECVVCLSGEKRIDSIFYRCAHACCHYECSKELLECPLCRSTIEAKLKLL